MQLLLLVLVLMLMPLLLQRGASQDLFRA